MEMSDDWSIWAQRARRHSAVFSAIFMDFVGVFDRAFPGVKRVWIHCGVQYTDCEYFPNFITSLLQHRLVYIAQPH
jgi:hypothetical protein